MARDYSREKRLEYLRVQGLAGYVPAGPVRARIIRLHNRHGITFDAIAARTGIDVESVKMHYHGVNKHGDAIRSCQRSTERAVLGAKFTPADGTMYPAVGIRRRLQALAVVGFPLPLLAGQLPVCDYRALHRTMIGRKSKNFVTSTFASAVLVLYDRLDGMDPVKLGASPHASGRARTMYGRNGFAPSHCWDVDTIDDPDALPEWTGACGTAVGYRIHRREEIPVCPPCQAAMDACEAPAFSPDLFRELRIRKGLSQRDVERRAGFSPGCVSHWERGSSEPRQRMLQKALSVLDATIEDVMEER